MSFRILSTKLLQEANFLNKLNLHCDFLDTDLLFQVQDLVDFHTKIFWWSKRLTIEGSLSDFQRHFGCSYTLVETRGNLSVIEVEGEGPQSYYFLIKRLYAEFVKTNIVEESKIKTQIRFFLTNCFGKGRTN